MLWNEFHLIHVIPVPWKHGEKSTEGHIQGKTFILKHYFVDLSMGVREREKRIRNYWILWIWCDVIIDTEPKSEFCHKKYMLKKKKKTIFKIWIYPKVSQVERSQGNEWREKRNWEVWKRCEKRQPPRNAWVEKMSEDSETRILVIWMLSFRTVLVLK